MSMGMFPGMHGIGAPAGTRPMGAMAGYGAPNPITQPMGANMNTAAHGLSGMVGGLRNPGLQGRPMQPLQQGQVNVGMPMAMQGRPMPWTQQPITLSGGVRGALQGLLR